MKKITHVSQRLALALVSVLGLFSMTIDSQAQDIVWSITVNPKLRLNPSGKVDPYIVGGVGYYRRQFTLPSRPWWMCSSSIHFFGVFFNTLVPANQVIGEITNSGAGGSLGAGFDMGIGNTGLKFFSEARYHYADTGRIPTRMVPVTFGIRW